MMTNFSSNEMSDLKFHDLALVSCCHVWLFCNSMDCPARFLCPWDFPGKNTGVSCHTLLQGILPTQGLNPGLLYCRRFFTLWATMEVPLAVLGKYVLFVDLSTLTDNLELNSWLYDGSCEASKRGQKKNQSPILWKPYTHCLHWTKGNRNDPVCILLCSPRLFKVYLKHQLLYQASWALHSECHLFFCFQSTSLYPWYSTSQTYKTWLSACLLSHRL